jgi:hypothetical protein
MAQPSSSGRATKSPCRASLWAELGVAQPGRRGRAAESRVRVAGWRRSGESTLAHADGLSLATSPHFSLSRRLTMLWSCPRVRELDERQDVSSASDGHVHPGRLGIRFRRVRDGEPSSAAHLRPSSRDQSRSHSGRCRSFSGTGLCPARRERRFVHSVHQTRSAQVPRPHALPRTTRHSPSSGTAVRFRNQRPSSSPTSRRLPHVSQWHRWLIGRRGRGHVPRVGPDTRKADTRQFLRRPPPGEHSRTQCHSRSAVASDGWRRLGRRRLTRFRMSSRRWSDFPVLCRRRRPRPSSVT